jgi:hypothetical protein
MAVIGGWMRRRLIFSRYRVGPSAGFPRLDREFDKEEIEELTAETVSKGYTASARACC